MCLSSQFKTYSSLLETNEDQQEDIVQYELLYCLLLCLRTHTAKTEK